MELEASPDTALGRTFFTPLYRPAGAREVFRWWEARRPLFNLCIGVTGLVSIGVVNALLLLSGRSLGFPLIGVLAFGLLANLCYTAGPIVDLLFRRHLGTRGAAVAPVMLRYGFVFSIGLSLLPIPVATIGFLLSILS
ncbi:MAG: hypothetical protein AB7R55_23335 [Gemmatimonadales bacterium]